MNQRRQLVIIAIVLSALGGLTMIRLWWIGWGPFDRYLAGYDRFVRSAEDQPDADPFLGLAQPGMDRLLQRSSELIARAQGWDPTATLSEMPLNPLNGFVVHLDDLLDWATPGTGRPDRESTEGQLFCRDFDPDEGPIANGVLRDGLLLADGSEPIELGGNLAVDKSQATAVRVRARHASGSEMTLLWPTKPRFDWQDPWSHGSLPIEIIADGEFHEYRVTGPGLFAFTTEETDLTNLERLFLRPTDTDGRVEIDYLCIESNRASYGRHSYGRIAEKLNGQLRPAVFMHTGEALEFPIELPPGPLSMTLGLGVLPDSLGRAEAAVIATVAIDGDEVLRETLSSDRGWHDVEIDLSPYGGRIRSLTLTVEGAGTEIVLWSAPTIYQPPARLLNVLLILQDTLRASSMSLYGSPVPTTPHTDRIAERAIVFEHAWAQATKTQPSCPSIMTGLYPSVTRVWSFHSRLHERFLTLPEVLRNQGFVTGAIIQNPAAGINAGLHRGYDTYETGFCDDHWTECGVQRATAWITAQRQRNFFLYLHLMKPHSPYDPPENHRQWYRESIGSWWAAPFRKRSTRWKRDPLLDPRWLREAPTTAGRRALYDGQIAHNDAVLGGLLDNLDRMGILDHTLVVLLSDHGEHLGEHNVWEHRPPGHSQVLRTPLVLLHPELQAPRRIRANVQNIDLMPTILDLAEIPFQDLPLQGDSLLPLVAEPQHPKWMERVTLSEEVIKRRPGDESAWGSVFHQGQHFLHSTNRPMERYSFWEDPGEDTAHVLSFSGDRRRLEGFLAEMTRLGRETWQAVTGGEAEVIEYDDESLDQLRALGYLGN